MLKKYGYNAVANDFESLITFMNSEDRQDLIKLFLHKMETLDIIRNEDFFKTFPELEVLRG